MGEVGKGITSFKRGVQEGKDELVGGNRLNFENFFPGAGGLGMGGPVLALGLGK